MHKTPSEEKVILDRLLENTSFMTQCDKTPPEALASKIEEPSIVESQPEPSTSTDLTDEAVPEPSSVENEEIQTLDNAPVLFRDGFDEDYDNTLSYFSKKKPLVPLPPPDPTATSIMSDEWLSR